MDYNMKISMVIDTESKKNDFRDYLLNTIISQYNLNTIKSWNMSINGIIVVEEDTENYTSDD